MTTLLEEPIQITQEKNAPPCEFIRGKCDKPATWRCELVVACPHGISKTLCDEHKQEYVDDAEDLAKTLEQTGMHYHCPICGHCEGPKFSERIRVTPIGGDQ